MLYIDLFPVSLQKRLHPQKYFCRTGKILTAQEEGTDSGIYEITYI
jgi:hypothetical protein